jgi:hypothetical protein
MDVWWWNTWSFRTLGDQALASCLLCISHKQLTIFGNSWCTACSHKIISDLIGMGTVAFRWDYYEAGGSEIWKNFGCFRGFLCVNLLYPIFPDFCTRPTSSLKMDAADSSKILAPIHQSTWHHIHDHNLNMHCWESQLSWKLITLNLTDWPVIPVDMLLNM